MTQPAVTFQVKQLEESLATRLFERSSSGTSLTPAGAVVYDYAERILKLLNELEAQVRKSQRAKARFPTKRGGLSGTRR